ncbi:MAG: Hsp20/alpha crystallin family protein [Planctomycetota bacterium]
MVWLNRTPFELLSDIDRLAAATVGRMARVAWPDGPLAQAGAPSVDAPRANVHLAADEAGLELLVPGYGPEHVEVTVERDRVTVKGARKEGEGEDARVVASFERRFKLPFEIDADAVQAKLELGVLRLALPRAARASARRVEVQ